MERKEKFQNYYCIQKGLQNYSLHGGYCIICRENPLYFQGCKFQCWCCSICTGTSLFCLQLCDFKSICAVVCCCPVECCAIKNQHLKLVIRFEHVKKIWLNHWCNIISQFSRINSSNLTKRNLEIASWIICCHFLYLEWALQTPEGYDLCTVFMISVLPCFRKYVYYTMYIYNKLHMYTLHTFW